MPHDDLRREAVTAREHALQCAQLAEWSEADASLVLAALLHDIGHFFTPDPRLLPQDQEHDLLPMPFLKEHFGPEVYEPIRLHVQAKRYLVARDCTYLDLLSPDSRRLLWKSGGPMCPEESHLFERLPFAHDAVALSTWDDMAREPGKRTPSLTYYLGLIGEADAASRQAAQRRRSTLLFPEPVGPGYLF